MNSVMNSSENLSLQNNILIYITSQQIIIIIIVNLRIEKTYHQPNRLNQLNQPNQPNQPNQLASHSTDHDPAGARPLRVRHNFNPDP